MGMAARFRQRDGELPETRRLNFHPLKRNRKAQSFLWEQKARAFIIHSGQVPREKGHRAPPVRASPPPLHCEAADWPSGGVSSVLPPHFLKTGVSKANLST